MTVKHMTIWGVGLKFALFSVLCFALALVVHVIWSPLFVIQGIPPVVLITVGLTLIAIGVSSLDCCLQMRHHW